MGRASVFLRESHGWFSFMIPASPVVGTAAWCSPYGGMGSSSERDSKSRSGGRVRIGRVDTATIEAIEREIKASGLWNRSSAPRYLDLPEDGLVIRQGSLSKCWFDTLPTAATPGLRRVADAILDLPLESAVSGTLDDDDWLPWSHYREEACR